MAAQPNTVKFFKTRDSATSLLRKLGVQSCDYGLFIEKLADGRIACQVTMAERHLESLKNPAPASTVKCGTSTSTTKSTKSISETARELILNGRTNQEVWAVIKETFNLSDSKKHYPSWYRCELKRKGKIPAHA